MDLDAVTRILVDVKTATKRNSRRSTWHSANGLVVPILVLLVASMLVSVPTVGASDSDPCDKATRTGGAMENPGNSVVALATDKGCMVVELYDMNAPVTVSNFLNYTREGFYTNLQFDRILAGFLSQTGRTAADGTETVPSHPPIRDEAASSGLANHKYTLAMVHGDEPDSAQAQFFINTAENSPSLDPSSGNPGWAVFGIVVNGRDVADQINAADGAPAPILLSVRELNLSAGSSSGSSPSPATNSSPDSGQDATTNNPINSPSSTNLVVGWIYVLSVVVGALAMAISAKRRRKSILLGIFIAAIAPIYGPAIWFGVWGMRDRKRQREERNLEARLQSQIAAAKERELLQARQRAEQQSIDECAAADRRSAEATTKAKLDERRRQLELERSEEEARKTAAQQDAELAALGTRVQGLRKRRDDLVRKHPELRVQEVDAALAKIPNGVTEATRPVADAAERILDAIDADLQRRAELMMRSAEIRKEHRGLSARLGKGEIGQSSFDRAFQALEAEEGDNANDMDQLEATLFEDRSEKPV